jgi:hypothetical protein
MKEIQLNKAKAYTVPAGVNKLQIVHEWGDIILADTTVSTNYSFTPTSIGVHKFIWKNNSVVVQTDFYDSVLPLTTSSDFVEAYASLEAQADDTFITLERRIRRVIQSFTQQHFGPFNNKTQTLEGQGGDTLGLRYRLRSLTSVIDEVGTDYTAFVERSPNTEYFIQKKSDSIVYGGRWGTLYYNEDVRKDITRSSYNTFSIRHNYTVVGDWGWEYVPQDVSEASMLLIADEMTGLGDLNNYGFNESKLGDFQFRMANTTRDFTPTTGNGQADALLAPYILMEIGLV